MKLTAEIKDFLGKLKSEFFARIDIDDSFPSGLVMIDIRIGHEMFVLETGPKTDDGYGVSRITEDTLPFTGHDAAFKDWPDAREYLKNIIAEHVRSIATATTKSETSTTEKSTPPPSKASGKLSNPH